jgi:hypothetical protein
VRAGEELEDDVCEGNRIPHQINRCPLGAVKRIVQLNIEVADVTTPYVTAVVNTRDQKSGVKLRPSAPVRSGAG